MKKITLETAEDLAEKFRTEELGVNTTEPINIKSALRKLDIIAVYRPLSEACCGLSVQAKEDKKKFILINSNTSRGRQHFTVAHEFFHLFYDDNPAPHLCNDMEGQREVSEKNANTFASALLLPKMGLLKFISPHELVEKAIDMSKLIRIEQYYGVSRHALLIRLKSLNLISSMVYEKLKKAPVMESVKPLGHDISLYLKGNKNLVIGDFGEKAKRLLDEEKISEGHYNELIHLISNGED